MGQADPMDRFIISCAGAIFAVASEVFWKGESRFSVALWGSAGMLLAGAVIKSLINPK